MQPLLVYRRRKIVQLGSTLGTLDFWLKAWRSSSYLAPIFGVDSPYQALIVFHLSFQALCSRLYKICQQMHSGGISRLLRTAGLQSPRCDPEEKTHLDYSE